MNKGGKNKKNGANHFDLFWAEKSEAGGDVAQLVEHRTGLPPMQVRFHGAAGDFSPRVNFYFRLSFSASITCIYACAHVKDPVVHARVRWIRKTLNTQHAP